METHKLRRIVDKYKLTYILKIVVVIIILFLIARAFIPSFSNISTSASNNVINYVKNDIGNIEGFSGQLMGYSCYGNELTLQDPSNKPNYTGNTCTFKFNGIYRIEGFQLNFNTNANSNVGSVKPFHQANTDKTLPILVQYEDGNGNMRNILSSSGSNFNNTTDLKSPSTTPICSKMGVVDENNLVIYTSKIVVSIGDASNTIDDYQDSCVNGYMSFAFWGSTRDMLSKADFENLQGLLSNISATKPTNQPSNFDATNNTNFYTFMTSEDKLVYGLRVSYSFQNIQSSQEPSPTQPCTPLSDSPFSVSIMYNNGLYPGNNFNVNQTYTIRNDPMVISYPTPTTPTRTYIIFPQPIIANKVTITSPIVNLLNNYGNKLGLIVNGIHFYGMTPSNTDKENYKKNVNLALNAAQASSQSADVCPNMDDLMSKQNQTQAICDNLEYQDRIKAEKLRLEKNKQYLLKLQQQQQQIDQLNTVIQTLDGKRQARATANDQARLLQYQQQRGTATTIRDLANQRLQSQAANQLYMDVNINTI